MKLLSVPTVLLSALLVVLPPGSSAAPVPAHGWSWPLSPRPAVVRGFDPPERPWLSGHRGVDLRAAADGATVTAPAAGRVSFAGYVVDRPVLAIDHGNGIRSSFEPVETTLQVGDAVSAGSTLGRALPGHCGGTPCVHWGVRRGEDYLNPLAFILDLRPSVLLPPERTAAGSGQTMAEIPVMALPVTRVLISWVPS